MVQAIQGAEVSLGTPTQPYVCRKSVQKGEMKQMVWSGAKNRVIGVCGSDRCVCVRDRCVWIGVCGRRCVWGEG